MSDNKNEFMPVDVDDVDSRLPEVLREKMLKIPSTYREMDETDLKKEFRVSERIELLRGSFWEEYYEAQRDNRVMKVSNVYKNITTKANWYKICAVHSKLAYVTCPIVAMESHITTILRTTGVDKIKEIMNQPLVDDNGKFDVNLARLQVQLYKQLDERLHGGIVQKVEQKSLNINVNKEEIVSREDLENKIKQIDEQLNVSHVYKKK